MSTPSIEAAIYVHDISEHESWGRNVSWPWHADIYMRMLRTIVYAICRPAPRARRYIVYDVPPVRMRNIRKLQACARSNRGL